MAYISMMGRLWFCVCAAIVAISRSAPSENVRDMVCDVDRNMREVITADSIVQSSIQKLSEQTVTEDGRSEDAEKATAAIAEIATKANLSASRPQREAITLIAVVLGNVQSRISSLGPTFIAYNQTWFGKTAAAYVMVVACCTDDIVWLMPFAISSTHKKRYLALYILCMLLTAVASWSLLGAGLWLQQIWPRAPINRTMKILSATFLAAYSVSLFQEWRADQAADCDDSSSAAGAEVADGEPENIDISNETAAKQEAEAGRSYRKLVIICIFGNLDNLAIYLSLMLSGIYGGGQLCVGSVLSGTTVAAICCGFGSLTLVVDMISQVPLWTILTVVALFTAADAILDDQAWNEKEFWNK